MLIGFLLCHLAKAGFVYYTVRMFPLLFSHCYSIITDTQHYNTMSKKGTWIILALMTVGLIGLVIVQVYWLRNAAELKERLFRASVNRALNSVAQRLEAQETQMFIARSVDKARQSLSAQTTIRKKHTPNIALATKQAAQQDSTKPSAAPSPESVRSAKLAPPPTFPRSVAVPSPPNPNGVVIQQQTLPNGQSYRVVVPEITMEMRDSLIERVMRKNFRIPQLRMFGGNQFVNQPKQGSVSVEGQPFGQVGQLEGKKTLRDMMAHRDYERAVHDARKKLKALQSQGVQVFTGDSVVNFSINSTTDGFGFEWRMESVPTDVRDRNDNNFTPSAPLPKPPAVKKLSALTNGKNVPVGHQNLPLPTTKRDTIEKIVYKLDLIEKALEDMSKHDRSIRERLDTAQLEFMLASSLRANDVTHGFEFGILRESPDSMIFAKTMLAGAIPSPALFASEFRTRLFPNDVSATANQLVVRFPDYKPAWILTFSPVLVSSGAFMLLIMGCFGFTMFTLVKQKKLSDMKTDFINNMTHELKTPIATISIASEALKEPLVRSDANRVERFVGVIHDENKRLAQHVEKVLQAALMERGELKLNIVQTNLHQLVEKTVKSLALQIEQRCGRLVCNLEALYPCIHADEQHVTNVIFNLIDNANKYSPNAPQITVFTRNIGDSIILSVADNGIGMSKEAQKHIFEKFYRVPTGNLHDVKGFGLGLSYVHSIVTAHGGTIAVDSEFGTGSRFEVMLPCTREIMS